MPSDEEYDEKQPDAPAASAPSSTGQSRTPSGARTTEAAPTSPGLRGLVYVSGDGTTASPFSSGLYAMEAFLYTPDPRQASVSSTACSTTGTGTRRSYDGGEAASRKGEKSAGDGASQSNSSCVAM